MKNKNIEPFLWTVPKFERNHELINLDSIEMPKFEFENPAETIYENIKKAILFFEKELTDEEEMGLKLVSFGNSQVYYINNIGYIGDNIIVFYCAASDTHKGATLIQHISQLNILLLKLPKMSPEKPARRIGF